MSGEESSPKGVSVSFQEDDSPDVERPRKGVVKLTGNEKSKRHLELKKFDKDGDGELAIEELLDMASAMRSFRKQRKWLVWAFLGLLIFVVVLVFTMLGVTYWAIILAKDYKVSPSDNNGLSYMADKSGNPLASNVPHITVDGYESENDSVSEDYKRMVMLAPPDSLHRRRISENEYDEYDDIPPAVTYQLLGTFPQSIILANMDVINSMSQLTAVLSSDNSTKTSFHFGKVISITRRADHIYVETQDEQGNSFDIDCPLKTSKLCYVNWITQPNLLLSSNSSLSKRASACCSNQCGCSTQLSVSECRQCGYDGYMCYVFSGGGPAAYKGTAMGCGMWTGTCDDCRDCGGFYNLNGELCRKRCGEQAKTCEPACFPENSLVTLQDGSSLPIQLLREGDVVAAVDEKGSVIFSPFLGFMHSGRFEKPESYKKITFTRSDNSTGEFHTSGDHRIFTQSGENEEKTWREPLPARHIQKGYTIFVMSSAGALEPVAVDDVVDTWLYGHYGPLTDAGTVIVSGVAASCYVESGPGHVISDMFMTPFKWAMKSKIALSSCIYGDVPMMERTAAPQFPLPGSFVDRFTQDVLIPAASYLN